MEWGYGQRSGPLFFFLKCLDVAKHCISLHRSTTQNSYAMNWIYNSMPGTTREVMVAFLMDPESDTEQNVHYVVTSASAHTLNGWSAIPDDWTVLAWADFPRLKTDADGKTLTHHWISIEGLK